MMGFHCVILKIKKEKIIDIKNLLKKFPVQELSNTIHYLTFNVLS